jgi:uncharacterized protein YjbI with pentapeptide repeats
MDKQQNATASATTNHETGPDNSEPTPERQAELRKLYEANVAVGKPPYAGVKIHSRGELDWIITQREWRTSEIESVEQRIDLRNASFSEANIRGASLSFANMRGVVGYDNADFSGVEAIYADFTGAVFPQCKFIGADLTGAILEGAMLLDADFSRAEMPLANLSAATLMGKLDGANMTRARMDAATTLGIEVGDVTINGTTRLLDVSWNGVNLAAVKWELAPRLGDELDIKEASSRKERVEAYRYAARTYYGLAKALEAQGLTAPALKYRRRQHQLERAAQFRSFNLLGWLFSNALNLVSGYGDRPLRALGVYFAVILAFAGIYFGITAPSSPIFFTGSQPLQFHEAVVFSLSSFHGRGFFPSIIGLGDPVAIVAALEAVVGLFIELVLIATFTRRLFER